MASGVKITGFTGQEAVDFFELAFRKSVMDFLRFVVQLTPVDTGRAKGNWITALQPTDKTLDINDKSGSQTISKGSALISADKTFHLFVMNNLNYVPILNTGTSTQAAAGFIERAQDAAFRPLQLLSR